jgi:hypothetical protein
MISKLLLPPQATDYYFEIYVAYTPSLDFLCVLFSFDASSAAYFCVNKHRAQYDGSPAMIMQTITQNEFRVYSTQVQA